MAVEVGAAPGPVRALRVVYDPEHATDVAAGENDGERLREYRIVREVETLADWDGAARRFTAKPPAPVRDRSSWCSRRTFGFSARRTCRPADQGNAAIVALTTSGSIFHSTMTNQDASRTAIHTTGANCAWLRRGRRGRSELRVVRSVHIPFSRRTGIS